MAKNLSQALLPLLFTASFLGLGIFKYPISKIIFCINFFYILCTWILYFYIVQRFYKYALSTFFVNSVSQLSVYCNLFITATSMSFCLYKSKNFGECLKKMSMVDNTLEELGFPKEYKKIRTMMIFVIIGWLAMTLFMNHTGFFWDNEKVSTKQVIVIFIINHFIHINTLMDLIFIILLMYGKRSFRKLNEYITLRCNRRRFHGGMLRKNPISLESHTIIKEATLPLEDYDIWISMHIHLELSRICDNLNTIFGVQMLLEMTSLFLFIVGLICELYGLLTTYKIWNSWKIKNVFDIIMWTIYYIIKCLSINITCEKVSFEANRTQELMQKVIDCLNLTIREEVLQFISEMTYKKLKFSAVGFYKFGYCFIRQFFGALTTFLIMLLQVESSPSTPNATLSST